jgi:hypothetical protein
MGVRSAFLGGLSMGVVGALAVAVWAAEKDGKQEKATAAAVARQAQHGREETAPIDEIPARVREALARQAAGAKIARYSYNKEDGFETYGAEWVVAGRECAASVTPDGDLIQHDEEVAAKDVPSGVRKAVAKALPGAKDVVFVKWITVEYDVQATVKDEEREIVVSPTGQVVETDEGDEQHEEKHENKHQDKREETGQQAK